MSKTYIPQALRELVAAQGHERCGYCLTQERVVGVPMEVEHIIPEALGGPTEEANLWLACSLCNKHKGDRVTGLDPLTGEVVGRGASREILLWGERCLTKDLTIPHRRSYCTLVVARGRQPASRQRGGSSVVVSSHAAASS